MTIYTINFTDPRRDEFIVNPYTANGLKFPTLPVLETGTSTARTSLLWYGKGSPNYGERIQENVLHLLEHFAGPTAPAHPVAGQLWFDRRIFFHTSATANANWYVWVDDPADPNGGSWSSISMVGRTGVGSPPAVNGAGDSFQYWLDTSTSTFYQGVNITGHPLNQAWSVCGYMEDTTVGVPNAAIHKPQQRLMVQTYGRTSLADNANWQLAGGVWASPIEPVDPTDGTLWYDTTAQALKVYNSAGSPPGFEAVVGAFLPLGGGTMTGQINMSNNRIVSLGTPIVATDAATKGYVDAALTSAVELNDLIDVGIAGPSVRQVLMYTGASPNLWTNESLLWSDLSDVDPTVTSTEINFLGGGTPVTSSIQLQLDDKLSLSGGNMTGNIGMNNNSITSLGTPAAGTDATNKNYVDGRDISSGTFDSGTGTLTLTRGDLTTIAVSGFLSASGLSYVPLPSELLGQLPPAVAPNNADDALHNLDNIVRRRTTPRRVVDVGIGGSPPQLTYITPYYEVGSHKLFVFVDGLKYLASSPGYQSVLFNPNAIGSPLAPPYQLSCDVDPVLPGGGSPAFDYQFDVVVDGGGPQTITINGGTNEADTFCSVVDTINTQLLGATAVLEDTAITIYSNSTGAGSSISITDGSVGSPILPLFASMAYFDVIDAAVPGADFDYVENGDVGDITNTITFTLPVTGFTLEFIVIGQSGTMLV